MRRKMKAEAVAFLSDLGPIRAEEGGRYRSGNREAEISAQMRTAKPIERRVLWANGSG